MEPDPSVLAEMRRMAAAGATPYDIAEMVWNGVANKGIINWIFYMRRAFGIPLPVLKGVSSEREALDSELAEWVHRDVSLS